ncbi:hypothetical protein DFJ74DRAFT_669056 [Hyaloraphidium curvatum]|nr:hypothetical protein DFJ74DRAFT_669056 [Hyaloraphidium curvatum]
MRFPVAGVAVARRSVSPVGTTPSRRAASQDQGGTGTGARFKSTVAFIKEYADVIVALSAVLAGSFYAGASAGMGVGPRRRRRPCSRSRFALRDASGGPNSRARATGEAARRGAQAMGEAACRGARALGGPACRGARATGGRSVPRAGASADGEGLAGALGNADPGHPGGQSGRCKGPVCCRHHQCHSEDLLWAGLGEISRRGRARQACRLTDVLQGGSFAGGTLADRSYARERPEPLHDRHASDPPGTAAVSRVFVPPEEQDCDAGRAAGGDGEGGAGVTKGCQQWAAPASGPREGNKEVLGGVRPTCRCCSIQQPIIRRPSPALASAPSPRTVDPIGTPKLLPLFFSHSFLPLPRSSPSEPCPRTSRRSLLLLRPVVQRQPRRPRQQHHLDLLPARLPLPCHRRAHLARGDQRLGPAALLEEGEARRGVAEQPACGLRGAGGAT